MLGKGSFGEVFLAQYNQFLYAIKSLPKKNITKNNLQRYAKSENNILQ